MPYCMKCGKEVNAGEVFCRFCGERLFAADRARAGDDAFREAHRGPSAVSEDDLAAFVGKNADVYLGKFRRFTAHGAGSFAFTWHWPAFLFGSFWMIYRKLYLWAIITFAIALVPRAGPLLLILLGVTGNYLYFTAARRRIRSIDAQPALSPVERTAAIARTGGTNGAAVFLVPVAAVVAAGIIAAVTVPTWHSSRQRAADAQARSEVEDACRRLLVVLDEEVGKDEVTPQDLLDTGFEPSPDVEMMLLDGRRGTIGLSAQHREGKMRYITEGDCSIREELKGPSDQI